LLSPFFPLASDANKMAASISSQQTQESHRTPGTWIARIYFTERFGQLMNILLKLLVVFFLAASLVAASPYRHKRQVVSQMVTSS
jgi:hypothetical protein